MINNINLTQIVSKNCGGYGAWIDNPLSSPAPGSEIWRGFQLGGGRRRKLRKSCKRMSRKSRKNKKHRQIKTRRQ